MEFIKNHPSRHSYSNTSSPRELTKPSPIPIIFNNPAVYPKLDAWLESLNHSPRNIDNHNFSQFLGNLTDCGVTRVHHLVPDAQIFADRKELMDACPTMNRATATLLLKFACEDVAKIVSVG